MFQDTKEGKTNYCEACEEEGMCLPTTASHTCGKEGICPICKKDLTGKCVMANRKCYHSECFNETKLGKKIKKDINKDICPTCSFEEGHSPNCIEATHDPKWQIKLIKDDVMLGKYGTKSRVELILRLEEVIELLP